MKIIASPTKITSARSILSVTSCPHAGPTKFEVTSSVSTS